MKSGWNTALEGRVRRTDPTARIMVEARVETAADLRQRYDQFQNLDSLPANAELVSDGGVRLKATGASGPGTATQTAFARSLLDSGATTPFMDPLVPKDSAPFLNTQQNRLAAMIEWIGSESTQMQLTQIQAWLHPRFSSSVAKTVAQWRMDLFAVVVVNDANPSNPGQGWAWQVVPLTSRPIFAPAPGEAAGFVTFDLSTWGIFPKSVAAAQVVVANFAAIPFSVNEIVMVALFTGVDANGNPATNIGLGFDGGHASQVSAAGSKLTGQLVKWLNPTQESSAQTGLPLQSPGYLNAVGPSGTVPTIQTTFGTYTAATVTFSTNKINLGTPILKANLELVGRSETPPGTSVTYQVQDDSAAWQTYTDGQTLNQIAGTFASASYQQLAIRSTLTPNTAADRTPILRTLGARAITITDLSDIAQVERVAWACDPSTHKAELPELSLIAIHDGERDFRDAISYLLANNPIGSIILRLWAGDKSLPKGQWCALDDFLIDDYDLAAPHTRLTALSVLALIRGALPNLTAEVDAYPNADTSNPGVWTASAGTTLWQALADNNGGSGLLPWDDSTYIQSVTNPANAQYTTALGSIGAPNQIAGIQVQYRYALSGGASLNLKVELMQGSTVIQDNGNITVNSATVSQGSFTLTGGAAARVTNWGGLSLRFTANGTGQLRVMWARLAVLPIRPSLLYANQTPQAVYSDLLSNQIALDARYRGPSMQGIPGLDTGTPITVSKTITSPPGGPSDLKMAKDEVDALAFVAGGVVTSSQGRVLYRALYDVAVDAASGFVTYTPSNRSVVLYIPAQELAENIAISPGFRYRVPLFRVPWGYDYKANAYTGEARGASGPALSAMGVTALGAARVDPPQRPDDRIGQWIPTQNLANGVALRHIIAFGLGLLVWRFRTTYAHPELEIGDAIAIQTDRFVAWDPTAGGAQNGRPLFGPMWVAGIVVGIYDVWGKDLAIWIPNWASLGPGNGPQQVAGYVPWNGGQIPIGAPITPTPYPSNIGQTSSWNNAQGSIIPSACGGGTSFFSWKAGGLSSGQMWASFGWTAQTVYRPDGSQLPIAAPPAAPDAPVLGQQAGGALGARTLFCRIAYARKLGVGNLVALYPVSAEASFAVSANNLLTVQAPGAQANYDGWCVLVGNTTNLEFGQPASGAGAGTTAILPFGAQWVENVSGFRTTNTQFDNANWKSVTLVDLSTSITLSMYPYFNQVTALVELGPFVGAGGDPGTAQIQVSDFHIPLSTLVSGSYSFAVNVPAAAGSNSGSGGGGRLT